MRSETTSVTRDTHHPLTFPIATYGLIGINLVVFVFELLLGIPFIDEFSMVPNGIVHGQNLYTLFTAMVLHANVLHIGINMLFLWVFGPNLEDVIGPVRYVIFYLLCGLAASAAQVAVDRTSTIPNLGSGGAIAGVLGGFILEFLGNRIRTLPFSGRGIFSYRLSAIVMIGLWFLLQFVGAAVSRQAGGAGEVAFFAHVGGFIAGLVLVKLFVRRRTLNPHNEQ